MSEETFSKHDIIQAQKLGELTATLKEHGSQLEAIFKDVHFIKNELQKVSAVPSVLEELKTIKHDVEGIKDELAPLKSTYAIINKILISAAGAITIAVLALVIKH